MPFGISRRYSMMKRYGVIIDTLIKYGFGYFVDQMGIRSFGSYRSRLKGRFDRGGATSTRPERARQVLEELGPTYVKFGQLISMRQDLIPVEYAREFVKLQNDVQPFPFEEVRIVVEQEFGARIEDIFEEFDEISIAAASIGQVHRAKLKGGTDVVVKVQRPGIRDVVDADIDILYSIAAFAEEHLQGAKLYNPVDIVDELSRSIHSEMDYIQEARNIERFSTNFGDDPHIYVPKVYWEYTGVHVLTMEFVEGVKCDDIDTIKRYGVKPYDIAEYTASAFMKQVFEDGFFHADLHSGNVFLLKNGKLALLDFGMVGYISNDMKSLLIDLLISTVEGDVVRYVEVLSQFGMLPDNFDIRTFKGDYDVLMNKYYGRSLKQVDTPTAISEMIGLMRKYQIKVPPNVALLFKGIMTLNGFTLQLYPDFNVTLVAEPYAKKIMKDRVSPGNLARSFSKDVWYLSHLFQKAPLQLSHILDIAEKGYLNLRFEHRGMDRIVGEINAASNRLSFSFIISAIIVGSSLIIQTGMEPHVWGVPLMGVMGFVIAGLLGLWLVIYILRTGNI